MLHSTPELVVLRVRAMAAKVGSDLHWIWSCNTLLVANKALPFSRRAVSINSCDLPVLDMLASPIALTEASSAWLWTEPNRSDIYGNIPHIREMPTKYLNRNDVARTSIETEIGGGIIEVSLSKEHSLGHFDYSGGHPVAAPSRSPLISRDSLAVQLYRLRKSVSELQLGEQHSRPMPEIPELVRGF